MRERKAVEWEARISKVGGFKVNDDKTAVLAIAWRTVFRWALQLVGRQAVGNESANQTVEIPHRSVIAPRRTKQRTDCPD